MKRIILLIVVGGIDGSFYLQKQHEKSAAEAAAKENTPPKSTSMTGRKHAWDQTNKVVLTSGSKEETRNRLSAALVTPLCKLLREACFRCGAPARPSCETLNADVRLLAPDEASSGSQL